MSVRARATVTVIMLARLQQTQSTTPHATLTRANAAVVVVLRANVPVHILSEIVLGDVLVTAKR